MKGKLLVLLIAVLMLTIAFSGCFEETKEITENSIIGDVDKLEIIDLQIVSGIQHCNYSEYVSGNCSYEIISEGFYSDENVTSYKVSGSAKNIATETIKDVKATIYFNKKDGSNVRKPETSSWDMRPGDIWYFDTIVGKSNTDNFSEINHIVLDIDVLEYGNISEDGELDRLLGYWINETNESFNHWFQSDFGYSGSYYNGSKNIALEGDWRVENNQIIIEGDVPYIEHEPINVTYNYTISDDNMYLTLWNENYSYSFKHNLIRNLT